MWEDVNVMQIYGVCLVFDDYFRFLLQKESFGLSVSFVTREFTAFFLAGLSMLLQTLCYSDPPSKPDAALFISVKCSTGVGVRPTCFTSRAAVPR